MSASGYVHLFVDQILRETAKAFCVDLDGEELWIPKSVISDADDYEVGDFDVELSIAEWFAEKEGIGQ